MTLLGIVTTKSLVGDARFESVAGSSDLVVATVDKRPNGTFSNAYSYGRETWRFAHEGTIDDIELLRRRVAPRRALQIENGGESACLFSFVLTCVDAVGTTDGGLRRAVNDIRNSGVRGKFSFVLSDADALYAYSGEALVWLARPHTIVVASEPLT
ncbi:MAG TPA: class II glutamine amidotransferase, partial [Polyangiaceae bacterium]